MWSCWAHEVRTWLFTAEMSLPLSRERGTPVLHIKRYSDELLEDSGTWTTTRAGRGTAARTEARSHGIPRRRLSASPIRPLALTRSPGSICEFSA